MWASIAKVTYALALATTHFRIKKKNGTLSVVWIRGA